MLPRAWKSVIVIAGLAGAVSAAPSVAAPLDTARAIVAGDTAATYAQYGYGRTRGYVQQRGYGRHYGHRRGNHGAAIGAGVAALAAGAIIGGLAAQAHPAPRAYYYERPAAYGYHGGYGSDVYDDDY